MGSGMSSMIKSGVSEVNQANIELNRDKHSANLQSLVPRRLVRRHHPHRHRCSDSKETEAGGWRKRRDEGDEFTQRHHPLSGPRAVAPEHHLPHTVQVYCRHQAPKAFAVMETAAMVTNVV